MTTTATRHTNAVHDYAAINYVATDPMERDKGQSRRLHEPSYMISSIDPMTGNDIGNLAGHPSTEDGNLMIYFESEETRQQYLDMPLDHPVRLPDNPLGEGYAEG